ncbi:hypothetical protein [Stappia indica]|uniref:hypothetical protein n=1 Tax=Stappia indica TaxID=538381 RepID=UPI0011119AD0|nr:hypothetical protein [Stappia indica]
MSGVSTRRGILFGGRTGAAPACSFLTMAGLPSQVPAAAKAAGANPKFSGKPLEYIAICDFAANMPHCTLSTGDALHARFCLLGRG